MPSALANNNKLEKQASVGSSGGSVGVAGCGGGGGGGNGGSGNQSSTVGQVCAGPVDPQAATTVKNTESSSSANRTASNNNANNAGSSLPTKEKGNAGAATETNNPMKQALITIEHKIRNLEKRKTKLESYRGIQESGKDLSSDQKAAVAKYDAVMHTLEFARDFSKQMSNLSKENEKEQKKQARKDMINKAFAETAKIREVLIIQNILSCFTDEAVRADFINGENGAVKLETADMDLMEKFCIDIQTRRPETTEDTPFLTVAQKAAEYLSMTIDGRPKQYGDSTFENLRRIFNQIQECGYLDKIYHIVPEATQESDNDQDILCNVTGEQDDVMAEVHSLEENMEELNVADENLLPSQQPLQTQQPQTVDGNSNEMSQPQQQQLLEQGDMQPPQPQRQPQQTNVPLQVMSQPMHVAPNAGGFQAAAVLQASPSGATTPVHMTIYTAAPPQQIQQAPPSIQQVPTGNMINVQQAPPPPQMVAQQGRQMMSSSPAAMVQAPVQTVQAMHAGPPPGAHFPPTTVRAVEQSYFKHHQYLQQLRPLAEVIGGGSFYFLQDSELDSPDMGTPVVFEAQPQQQLHIQHVPQQQHPSVLAHVEQQQVQDIQQHELHKQEKQPQPQMVGSLSQVQLQQPPQQSVLANNIQPQSQQKQPTVQQQPIQTQTFTNQSFPPLSGHSSTSHNNINNNAGVVFQTQQLEKQLFSPGTGLQPAQQLVPQIDAAMQHQNQQVIITADHQQQPIMIMARMAPQGRIPPQQPQKTATLTQNPTVTTTTSVATGMQSSEVPPFPFDNAAAGGLNYDQQLKPQTAAVAVKPSVATATEEVNGGVAKKVDDAPQFAPTEKPLSEWQADGIKTTTTRQSNTTVVSSSSVSSIKAANVRAETVSTKWSSELNAVTSQPPTATSQKKSEWTSSNSGGGGNDGGSASVYVGDSIQQQPQNQEGNHWHNASSGPSHHNEGGGGNYSRGGRGSYQRRDDRRGGDRDDRGRSSGGMRGMSNSSGGNYRGRSNYTNSSSHQQNGGGGGRGGMYFRNNDNSYYQNGGGNAYSGKDGGNGSRYESAGGGGSRYDGGGGGYRGRGGGNHSNNSRNVSQRSIGRGGSTSSANSYINPRQQSSRQQQQDVV